MRIHTTQRVFAAITSVVGVAAMMVGAAASSGSAAESSASRGADDRLSSRGVSWE
jgi:hypothetical protein